MAKSVFVKRETSYRGGEFGQMKKKGAYDAIRELSKEGLSLYMYLTINNVNGYTFTLSPSAIAIATGISEGRAKNITSRGYTQLKEAGFIREENGVDVFYADGVPDV